MLTGEEVLIHAEDLRTGRADPFPGPQLQIPQKPAFNGGARKTLALRQSATADAIKVLLAYAAPERLGGAQARQNAGEPLPEAAAAGPALPFPRL